MKQFYFFLVVAFLSLSAHAQIINFPDANFKAALVTNPAINTNGDSEINVNEANVYLGVLDVNGLNINSLVGIEYFISINTLFCYNNNIVNLNITANTFITTLNCQNNDLQILNAAGALETLICNDNLLTDLDFSNYPLLTYIQCQNNNINSLNLAFNTSLSFLNCSDNNLYVLDTKNGANNILTTMSAIGNPLLNCIEVDDQTNANAGNGVYASWLKDATATYAETCVSCDVTIPDTNFKNALLADLSINQNNDSEIQCVEAEAITGTLNVNNLSIGDLTGIEAFINVTDLRCKDNLLTSIDLSSNTALTNLNCNNNGLLSLDLSNNTALSTFSCTDTALSSLSLSTNTALTAVICHSNPSLANLNLKNGTNNIMVTMEANNNPLLACINVDNEALANAGSNVYANWVVDTQITYSEDCNACIVTIPDTNFKNALLNDANINTNADSEIQCNEAVALTGILDVGSLSISDLTGIETFFNITELNCDNNNLSSLNLSLNSLQILDAFNNDLTSINVENCSNLQTMNIDNNDLPNLDLSNNVALTALQCEFNDLVNLNLKNGNNNSIITMLAHNNSTLQCIQVDNEVDANAGNGVYALWAKDTTAIYSEDCATLSVEVFNENTLTIYPNPVNDSVTISIKTKANYKLINIKGQILKEGKLFIGNNAINVPQLQTGLYFIVMQTETISITKKIIKK